MPFVIWLISLVIGLYLLHYVIRTAIDRSETTRLLREIRDLLKKEQEERNFRL